MTISKDSPQRRKSIAVLNQNKPSSLAKAKRRPHSIVGGTRLSPLAKSRRSLVPRKSILKTFTNTLHTSDNASSQSQEQSSQRTQPTSSPEDPEATQSMDITRDFHTKISDNASRKSFGSRRVSFAESVRVRLIEGSNKDNTNSTQSPQSSPISEPPAQPSSTRDENDYPGSRIAGRRRSSAQYSIAFSEDMDLTSVDSQAFLPIDAPSVAGEEILSEEGEDGMDMTGVVPSEIIRKRSLSIGNRPPLAQLPRPDPLLPLPGDHDQSRSFEENGSQSLSDDPDQSQQMDFTMPLSRSKRPPAEHDAAWLALRNVTHSGDTPIEPEPSSDDYDHGGETHQDNGMDLNDAVQRLMRARESLPSLPAIPNETEGQVSYDSTFSSEGSLGDQDNQTMNISAVLSRIGQGDIKIGRTSMSSTMDESDIYGPIVSPSQSTPRQPAQHQLTLHPTSNPAPTQSTQETSKTPVFTPQVHGTSPAKFKTPGPSSPSKTKQSQVRTGFSAAFALPVSPKKRLQPSNEPSIPRSSRPATTPSQATSRNTSLTLPKPLSPHKKAPFQASEGVPPTRPSLSSVRRPSGYFSKRKSLGSTSESQGPDEITNLTTSPPKKQARLDFGRASMGSRPAHTWSQMAKDTEPEPFEGKKRSHHDRGEALNQSSVPVINDSAVHPSQLPAEVTAPPEHPTAKAMSLDFYDDEEEENIASKTTSKETNQQENAVDSSGLVERDDQSPISIQQFFAMTEVKFMDELSAPRRSTRPSQQGTLQVRSSEDIPLADFVVAMGIDIPQLVLYSRVSKDLDAWIEKSKTDFEQAEDEASRITPQLFIEYSRADEEGQNELLHHLQLIRTNARALAKSGWYDWKIQWLEGLHVTAAQTFQNLEADAKVLEDIKLEADKVIFTLRQEYEEAMKLLEIESAEVAEIDACDQGYLNELKTSVAEQNIEVEALRAELTESKAKQSSLQDQVDEMNMLRKEIKAVIDDARQNLGDKKIETQAEVIKLKAELESLEDLHMFRATRVDSSIFEYIYASLFHVSIPCKNFKPITSQVEISRLDRARTRVKDDFPNLSDFFLHAAKELIMREGGIAIRQIINRLSDYWSSCAQLRAQLNLLSLKFPMDIEVLRQHEDGARFKVKVMLLFPEVKSKAFISFVFHEETFCHWPIAIHSIGCDAEVVYGPIDRDVITNAVAERLSQATPEDNYGCLFDACVLAQETYQQT